MLKGGVFSSLEKEHGWVGRSGEGWGCLISGYSLPKAKTCKGSPTSGGYALCNLEQWFVSVR